jgi:hypothetical protein
VSVAIHLEAGAEEVAGATKAEGIKAADVVTKEVVEAEVVVAAEAAASRGLNQLLLDGIRDTSSHACPTTNGTKCVRYATDAKLDLSVPATALVIMVAIMDMAMAMAITTQHHHHQGLLRLRTSSHIHHRRRRLCSNKYHRHHRHLLPIISELFTSNLATWATQLSIVSPMAHPASDMSCHTTCEQWWAVYSMTCQASCQGPSWTPTPTPVVLEEMQLSCFITIVP